MTMTLYYLRYGLSLLDYTVTVIQDEDVALAPGPQKNYFGGAVLSMTPGSSEHMDFHLMWGAAGNAAERF